MGGVLADHHGLLGQDEKGLGAGAETHLLPHGTKPGPKVWALFVSAQSQCNVAFWSSLCENAKIWKVARMIFLKPNKTEQA